MGSGDRRTAAGAADGGAVEVDRDLVRRHGMQVDELAVRRQQLQPGRVQVQVAAAHGIPLLLARNHPVQALRRAAADRHPLYCPSCPRLWDDRPYGAAAIQQP